MPREILLRVHRSAEFARVARVGVGIPVRPSVLRHRCPTKCFYVAIIALDQRVQFASPQMLVGSMIGEAADLHNLSTILASLHLAVEHSGLCPSVLSHGLPESIANFRSPHGSARLLSMTAGVEGLQILGIIVEVILVYMVHMHDVDVDLFSAPSTRPWAESLSRSEDHPVPRTASLTLPFLFLRLSHKIHRITLGPVCVNYFEGWGA